MISRDERRSEARGPDLVRILERGCLRNTELHMYTLGFFRGDRGVSDEFEGRVLLRVGRIWTRGLKR